MAQVLALNDPNLYAHFEQKYGLPQGILYAQAKQESNFNPKARSPVGADGLMQFMPATAKQYGIDSGEPVQSIDGAGRMMSELLQKYGGDTRKALASYNWGTGNVDKKGMDKAPMETQKYIAMIEKTLADVRGKPQDIQVAQTETPQTQTGDTRSVLDDIMSNLDDKGLEKLENQLKSFSPEERKAYKQDMIDMYNAGELPFQRQKQNVSQETPKEMQDTSLLSQLGRGAGLAARSVAEGVLGLPLMAGDAFIEGVPNKVIRDINSVTGANIPTIRSGQEGLQNLMNMAGVPQPETPTERIAGTVGQFLGGTGSMIAGGANLAKSANPIISGIGETLAARPVLQGAGAVTGGLAAGTTKEEGGSVPAQFAAGLIGGVAPSIPSALSAGTKSILRGNATPQQIERNIADFERVGTSPTVGQATENFTAQAIESGLARSPGGAGIIGGKSEETAATIGSKVNKMANDLSGIISKEGAGRAIERGIKQEFIPSRRGVIKKLENKFSTLVPSDTQISIGSTNKTLQKLTDPVKGAKKLSEVLSNPLLQKIKSAIDEDTGGVKAGQSSILDARGTPIQRQAQQGKGTLPIEVLRDLRTEVGQKLEGFDLSPDVTKGEWKQIYGALTSDMEQYAKQQSPQAYNAFKRANNFTKAYHKRIETVLDPVLDRYGGAEKVYNAALANTKEGATVIRGVMRSVPKDVKNIITSNVLRRLGKAINSQQDDLGQEFSTETYLTNWNKLDDSAKDALFAGQSTTFKNDLNTVAKVASNIRQGSKVFRNPSGTAGATANIAAMTTFLSSLVSGNVGLATVTGASVGGLNLTARAMTNPTFIRWLAVQSRNPKFTLAPAINSLKSMAKTREDQDALDIANELEFYTKETPQ